MQAGWIKKSQNYVAHQSCQVNWKTWLDAATKKNN